MKYLFFSLLLLGASPLFADVTVNLDAGELTGPPTAPMMADDSSGSPDGSLLLIIDLGSSDTDSEVLNAGSYVSGTNSILAAGGFNTNGGTNETLTGFDIPNTILNDVSAGDDIALRWFPQVTLAEYDSGTLPTGGEVFGNYNPDGGNPDGGDKWIVPSDGSTIALDFYTMNSDGGGTQLAIEGLADDAVVGTPVTPPPVLTTPEPSTSALILVGLALMAWTYRRRVVANS